MHKVNISDGRVDGEKTFYFSTKAAPIQTISDAADLVSSFQAKVDEKIDRFTNKGSNWVVAAINDIKLCLVKYRVLSGGAKKFTVPKNLAAKTCVLNIDRDRSQCFKYAVVAALHFKELNDIHHRNRHTQYEQYISNYNFDGIKFPATAEDIKKFVEQNEDVAINALLWVHGKEDKPAHIVPVWHPPHKVVLGRKHLATILLVDNHWLAVTSLDRLLSTQTRDGAHGQHNEYCYRCLRNLYSREKLKKHMEKCVNRMGQREVMPEPEEAVKQFDD